MVFSMVFRILDSTDSVFLQEVPLELKVVNL